MPNESAEEKTNPVKSHLESLPPAVQEWIRGYIDERIGLFLTEGDREWAENLVAYEFWVARVMQMHKRFLSELGSLKIVSTDSIDDIASKTDRHRDLLRWHHYALHPNEDSQPGDDNARTFW